MTERIPTEEEMERMLAGILPASISPDAQASMEAGIKAYIRKDLEGMEMTEEDMEQMTYALGNFFQTSQVRVGEAVGPLAALSTGEPATQMQLSAHRMAGVSSKSVNEGVPRFQELLRATIHQKAISMTIYFWERQTLPSIRRLASTFVYRTLANFLVFDGAIVNSKEELQEGDWQEDYRILYNYRAPTPNYVLRLRMDPEELARYQFTPDRVVEKLKEVYPEPVYLYSSTDIATIDVHVAKVLTPEAAPYITEENALRYYLRDVLLPALKEVQMTGIAKITDVFPRQQELHTFISGWQGKRVTVARQKAEQVGVNPADLIPLLRAAGYEPAPRMEGDVITLGVAGGSIAQLNERIQKDAEVQNLNGTWYLETNGSNLAEVLALSIVNNEVTFCTDVTEIYTVFGIQAARDYLLEQFISILSSDSYMDPRHLILLADVMTNLGLLAAATASGVSRQKTGPLTRAGFERPVEHFLRAAGFGESEQIRGVAASVFAGKKANIGPDAYRAPVIETVEEGQEEVEEEKAVTVVPVRLPEELTLDEAVTPVALPPRVLPTKVSMYANRGNGGSNRNTTAGSSSSSSSGSTRPPAPPPTASIELPDELTLEEAQPVAPVSTVRRPLPSRRIGGPPPVATGPSSIPVQPPPTTTTATSSSSTLPPRRPLPRMRF